MAATLPEHLQPSQLGKKSYWDNLYALEQTNFSTNPEDEGTIWFEDSNAEHHILRYIESLDLDSSNTTFLDVGTGNGHLLFSLLEDGGFDGRNMLGIDYSQDSITLAEKIREERGDEYKDIKFKTIDFVRSERVKSNLLLREDDHAVDSKETSVDGVEQAKEEEGEEAWDVVLDKGTFDAISLSDETVHEQRLDEIYIQKVGEYVKEDTGILLITSCNWTEDELKSKFLAGGVLSFFGRIKYPSFTFGGATGSTIASVAFKRKSRSS